MDESSNTTLDEHGNTTLDESSNAALDESSNTTLPRAATLHWYNELEITYNNIYVSLKKREQNKSSRNEKFQKIKNKKIGVLVIKSLDNYKISILGL